MKQLIAISQSPGIVRQFYQDEEGKWVLVMEKTTIYSWRHLCGQNEQSQRRESSGDSSEVETLNNLLMESRCQLETLKKRLTSISGMKSTEAAATCQLNVRCLEDVRSGLMSKAINNDNLNVHLEKMEELIDLWQQTSPHIEQKHRHCQMRDHQVPLLSDSADNYDNVNSYIEDEWCDNSSAGSGDVLRHDSMTGIIRRPNDCARGDSAAAHSEVDGVGEQAIRVQRPRRMINEGEAELGVAEREFQNSSRKPLHLSRASYDGYTLNDIDIGKWRSGAMEQVDVFQHYINDLSNEFSAIERALTDCESRLRSFENDLSNTDPSANYLLEINRNIQAELISLNSLDDVYDRITVVYNDMSGNPLLQRYSNGFRDRLRRIRFRKHLLKQWCTDLLHSTSSPLDNNCQSSGLPSRFQCTMCSSSARDDDQYEQSRAFPTATDQNRCLTIQQRRLHYIRKFWRSEALEGAAPMAESNANRSHKAHDKRNSNRKSEGKGDSRTQIDKATQSSESPPPAEFDDLSRSSSSFVIDEGISVESSDSLRLGGCYRSEETLGFSSLERPRQDEFMLMSAGQSARAAQDTRQAKDLTVVQDSFAAPVAKYQSGHEQRMPWRYLRLVMVLISLGFALFYFLTYPWNGCSQVSYYRRLQDIAFPLYPPIC